MQQNIIIPIITTIFVCLGMLIMNYLQKETIDIHVLFSKCLFIFAATVSSFQIQPYLGIITNSTSGIPTIEIFTDPPNF